MILKAGSHLYFPSMTQATVSHLVVAASIFLEGRCQDRLRLLERDEPRVQRSPLVGANDAL